MISPTHNQNMIDHSCAKGGENYAVDEKGKTYLANEKTRAAVDENGTGIIDRDGLRSILDLLLDDWYEDAGQIQRRADRRAYREAARPNLVRQFETGKKNEGAGKAEIGREVIR
jgi:hypothetical protein